MDMSQYYGLFISEAREHVRKISELAVRLEADPADRPTIDALFRSAHSVKGMAASMGFNAISGLSHKLEDLMDRIRQGLTVDATLFDLLLSGSDRLAAMIDDIETGGTGTSDIAELEARIAGYYPAEEAQSASPASLQQSESASPAPSGSQPSEYWAFPQTVRIKTGVLDSFVNTTGELITVKHKLNLLVESGSNPLFTEAMRDLERHLRDLRDQVMAVRLMPMSSITERFPRLVRDLAKSLGKEVSFSMTGVEMELDRSILELIGDPLAHMLRNCVDHGIEPPETRSAAGKPAAGTIFLSVSRVKDRMEITLVDDGKGMDPEAICAVAVSRGVIQAEKVAALSPREKLMLICQPGFSTAEWVTEVSGRGVGMDVVKSTIHSLGGALSITSSVGAGSNFVLTLPLTVAIVNVLLVSVGRFTLAVPITVVNRTLELRLEELANMEGRDFFFLGEETVPLISLRHCLQVQDDSEPGDIVHVLITEIEGSRTGFCVDRILGQKEIFVKPLAFPLSLFPGLAGATILGDGEIVFVLDILSLLC